MNFYATVLFFTALRFTNAFELISGTSFLIGAALSYYYGRDTIKAGLTVLDLAVCSTGFQIYECCGKPWIEPSSRDLRADLRNFLFGQHIVQEIVPAALESSIDEYSPTKPLVLSFHGPTGVGKNYVASFIAQNYFRKEESSKFYHYFNSRKDFPYQDKYLTYQDQLRSWIIGNVTQCPFSMFVFDEVDKMPPKILDGIKPFLDHHKSLSGVDYRRAVFIFISNIGSRIITERYLELWRNKGKKREEMTVNDFDKVINKGAFNERGGFQMSDIIDHNLIDFYVPFLPLERSHVEQCIKKTMKRMNHHSDEEIIEYGTSFSVTHRVTGKLTTGKLIAVKVEWLRKFIATKVDRVFSEVMKTMTFGPEPEALFAHSGCKRLDQQVRAHINKKKYRSSFEI